MVTPIDVHWDSRELRVFRNRVVDKAILRAALKAGNRSLRELRTQARREVRKRKKIQAKRVLQGLPIIFPNRKGELQRLVWEMKISNRITPVASYPIRQTRQGVLAEINPGARKLIRGAFIATLGSGHKGVFMRKGRARLPIQELFSTRIADVFQDDDLVPALQSYTGPRFTAEFARLLNLELSKLGR